MFIGLTDYDWYTTLMSKNIDEVNFWRPSGASFAALQPNELFLFKLKKPYYAIVGGGFFISFSQVPIDLAWKAFGEKNGASNYSDFASRIIRYREKNHIDAGLPYIGCIILTQPFFFNQSEWIHPPQEWPTNVVSGMSLDPTRGDGLRVYREVMDRLSSRRLNLETFSDGNRYTEGIVKQRIGQGAFRILVTDAYQRRCSVSGEKTLPVLQAAHIKPFSQNGTHEINNGILLRSDIHTLFDDGYLTITKDYTIEVSQRLHDDYGNGKDYFKYHGKKLLAMPQIKNQAPSPEYLNWHNEHVYLG